ncbi:hypothetical protein [Chiayiivirga flava]|uniref:Uncharacterized protein n=1 Tax=Chiayiivirga flava TaxID=659595 RepID=A0A7W8D7X1_9GAMM|nr:hypothetical protein [Chiayiivirga flava]MBB5209515.1 hypothetical protein [Chiayiivirga flava]
MAVDSNVAAWVSRSTRYRLTDARLGCTAQLTVTLHVVSPSGTSHTVRSTSTCVAAVALAIATVPAPPGGRSNFVTSGKPPGKALVPTASALTDSVAVPATAEVIVRVKLPTAGCTTKQLPAAAVQSVVGTLFG